MKEIKRKVMPYEEQAKEAHNHKERDFLSCKKIILANPIAGDRYKQNLHQVQIRVDWQIRWAK